MQDAVCGLQDSAVIFSLWLIFNANEAKRQGSHYDYEVL